jgi:hypothetical protein
MDFLKKNYEKILLGVVLLAFLGAVGYLPFKVSSDKQALEDKRTGLVSKTPKPLPEQDMTNATVVLKRVSDPIIVNFSAPNKLFNPMPWQQKLDKTLILTTSVGAGAATVTNITPLYLRLTLDGVNMTDTGARYTIGVQKEASSKRAEWQKKQTYCSLNNKTDTFTLSEVQGKAEDPTGLVVELNDTGERAVITKDKGFKRVDGYMATIIYEPQNQNWPNQRVGAKLRFNAEDYNIVAITQNEVVLSAKSNGKKWTIQYNAAP